MFLRVLSLLILLACAGNTAFAGVMTLEREAPTVKAGFSMSDEIPMETAVILQAGGGDTGSMAVANVSPTSTLCAVVLVTPVSKVETAVGGRLRIHNACLPPSPELDSLLKPS